MADVTAATCPSMEALEQCALGNAQDASVQQHVDGCDACRDQMEEIRANNDLLLKLRESCTDDGVTRAHAPVGEERIAGYVIEQELHRGGQGIVYEAIQQSTNRKAAIKVLVAGSLATSRQRARFEREIELVSRLRHPNIVTLYESGVTEGGRRYLAMEFVQGSPIDSYVDELCARGGLPRNRVLEMFCNVCDAVADAHRHGVIHRDLKPQNVLVDTQGEPRVVDFGLAAITDGSAGATMTEAGAFVGTLAYASPEQTSGEPGAADVRSDVYALGVMLYRLLSGRLPYEIGESLASAVHAINEQAPASLRTRRTDGEPFAVDDELETIVMRALAKAPERRYQSASALKEDIERYLAGEAIDAKRDSGLYVLRKAASKHRVALAFASLAAFALIAFSVMMAGLYQRALIEAKKTRQINVFLEDTLVSVEPAAGVEPTIRETLDEAAHWVDLALGDDPEIAAAIRNTVGNSYRALGEFDLAEAQLLESLKLRRSVFGDSHPETAKSVNSLGNLEAARGNYGQAGMYFDDARDILAASSGDHQLEQAQVVYNMARVHLASSRPKSAAQLFKIAGDMRAMRLGNEHADVAMTLFQRARCMEALGDRRAALTLDEQALAMRKAALHPEHPDLQRSWLALGDAYLWRLDVDSAEAVLRACLRVRERSLPHGHWRIGEAQSRLGECLLEAGDPEQAMPLLESGAATLLATRGTTDPRTKRAAAALEKARSPQK